MKRRFINVLSHWKQRSRDHQTVDGERASRSRHGAEHPHASDALPDVEYVTADFDDPESIRQRWKVFTGLSYDQTERVERSS